MDPIASQTDTEFRVYNQGGRLFTHFELQIPPGKFTSIPSNHAAGVRKLLEKYPHELISAEDAATNSQKLSVTITELRSQVAMLTEENAKLKADSPNSKEMQDLRERTAKAEADLKLARTSHSAAVDRVNELEIANTAATAQLAKRNR